MNVRRWLTSAIVVIGVVASTSYGQQPAATHDMIAKIDTVAAVPPMLRLPEESSNRQEIVEPSQATPQLDRQAIIGSWETDEGSSSNSDSLQAMVRKIVFGTGTVLILCVGFLFFGKRWLQNGLPIKQTQHLQHLASLQLPNRCSVQLVDADGCRVLVGTDASGVKMIVPLHGNFWDEMQGEGDGDSGDVASLPPTNDPPRTTVASGFDADSMKATFQQFLSGKGAA